MNRAIAVRTKKEQWETAYQRRQNFLFYPHEEIIRFVSRFIRKRIGFSEFVDVGPQASADVNVIDLGCGIGRHLVYGHHMGLSMYGIDLSCEAVTIAANWLFKEGCKNAANRVCQGDIRALPWPEEFFTYGLAHGVLDSMPFTIARSGIEDLARAMHPGGLFYCDLISGDRTGLDPSFDGEVEVEGEHEQGTIQSHFTADKIESLFADRFAIVEKILLRRENHTTGTFAGRWHVIARRL